MSLSLPLSLDTYVYDQATSGKGIRSSRAYHEGG